jgi:hypothetical protein
MPHHRILNEFQISQLVEDRTVNATPFRALGLRYGISASSAFNYCKRYGKYWKKYDKDIDSASVINEPIKADTDNAQILQDYDFDAETLEFIEWYSKEREPSQASISSSESYRHKCGQTSHGHNGAGERVSVGITANTTAGKNDNGEPFKPDNSVPQKSSLNKLEKSHVFTTPSSKRKRYYGDISS